MGIRKAARDGAQRVCRHAVGLALSAALAVLPLPLSANDLQGELARSQQQIQLLQEEVELLRKRLKETATQLQDTQAIRDDFERQLKTLGSSIQRGGGAMITANNSLRPPLPSIPLPGIEARHEGDVVRIELPADRLFAQGTVQLLPTAPALLDQVAELIRRDYSGQMIGIEGHTDNLPNATLTGHVLGANQAVVVFDLLTRRSQLPVQQLFVVAHGSNHPLVSNATPTGRARNRRVEVVIYPEKVTR
jgi:flagellar motor protein MotB